jgi:hypothetical protein
MRVVEAFVIFGLISGASNPATADESSVLPQLEKLPWKPEAGFSFPNSKMTLAALRGYVMVTGQDAISAQIIEDADASPNTEAEIVGVQNQEAIFSYSPGQRSMQTICLIE